jgi:molybdenum cofactor guanylyltransferase
MAAPPRPDFDAVILAGGRARRLGGADKPGLVIGTTTMAAAVTAAAAAAGARRVVLVGPPRPELAALAANLPGGLVVIREEPPGSGPVPALRAGLAGVTAPWVAVLAADLPFLRAADLRDLLAAAAPDQDPGAAPGGAVLGDDEGIPQWLAGCWRTSRLRVALRDYRGSSLRGVLAPLGPVLLRVTSAGQEPPPWLDCDTPEALEAARVAVQRTPARQPGYAPVRPDP